MELIALKSSLPRKTGLLVATAALAASVALAGPAGMANAAPVSVVIDADYVVPGGSATLTVDGCSDGATLSLDVGGEVETVVLGGEVQLPLVVELTHGAFEPGELVATATCVPAEGSEEVESSASDRVHLFDQWLEGSEFIAGEPATITAGDFVPGVLVDARVYRQGTDELVFEAPLGTAGEDFSVSGQVTFPADLESGHYDLDIIGGDIVVGGSLCVGVCDLEPTPEPTPSATPTATTSPTPSPVPSPTPSPSPTATASPSATVAPAPTATQPAVPGLPSTGN